MAQRFNPRDVNFYGNLGSIGIPKLDGVIGGGIPRGFTIVARGDAGSGMELFAKQFVSPVEDPKKTFYVSTTEKDDEIRTLMQMKILQALSHSSPMRNSASQEVPRKCSFIVKPASILSNCGNSSRIQWKRWKRFSGKQ